MTEKQKIAFQGLTCPLTCVKCGALIERGDGLMWNRRRLETQPLLFWHAQCPSGTVAAVSKKRNRRKN